jgi:hypothetical protein
LSFTKKKEKTISVELISSDGNSDSEEPLSMDWLVLDLKSSEDTLKPDQMEIFCHKSFVLVIDSVPAGLHFTI